MEELIGALNDLGVGESEKYDIVAWVDMELSEGDILEFDTVSVKIINDEYQEEVLTKFDHQVDSQGSVTGDGKRCYADIEGIVYKKGCRPEDSEHYFKITWVNYEEWDSDDEWHVIE